ncbi:MAG: metalloregulator ArsR/SmtB family transcription factor [Candidatus Krumholzibacteriota bacterium]|nr:metalloregulator ArsR/SmtB family transcription factor [Candidatus Krumholzibacteriota bacterium]
MNTLIPVFKALSDKNRVRILKILQVKPLCVCEITEVLGLAISTTSKHLSILKEANLIFEQREHKWINYYINQKTQKEYAKEILGLLREWVNDDSIIHNDLVKASKVSRNDLCKGKG